MRLHKQLLLSVSSSLRSLLQLTSKPLIVLSVIFVPALGQQKAPSLSFPTKLAWSKQNGVTKYRLQIASDENFSDVFFDGQVNGERYTVCRMPPGYYYWRVAPSDSSTGQFIKPVRFFISGGTIVAPAEKARPSATGNSSNHSRRG